MKTSIRILLAIISLGIAAACNAVRPLTILATDEPPGVGEKADKGYAACEPVIAALEAFRAAHGAYPEQLAELVPEYVPDAPVKTDDLDFSYSSTGDTYSLSFHYLGPGMNTCTYKPAAGWHCSGAF